MRRARPPARITATGSCEVHVRRPPEALDGGSWSPVIRTVSRSGAETRRVTSAVAVPALALGVLAMAASPEQRDRVALGGDRDVAGAVVTGREGQARHAAADAVGIAGARYRTWFGAVSSQNMSVVRTHFDNMDFVTRSGSTEFICDCTTANAYAYVNKSFPGQVHLCPLFWSTSNTQRANSIIHELSHLSKSVGVAGANGTEDYVYGQTQAEQLAHANPGYAVDNAENYGFYAQNPYGQSN